MRTTDYRLGLVLVTASAVAWSTAGLFTRLLTLDSWTMVAWRGMFAAAGVLAIIVLIERGRTWREFRRLGWAGWFFALLGALGMTFFITALRHTTVAHVAVIYATIPFLAALLGWVVMREIPGGAAIAASLAALAGVAIMVGLSGEGSLYGDLLALGMTACMTVFTVLARKYPAVPVMPSVFLSALMSGAFAMSLTSGGSVTSHDLVLLALFGLVNSAAGLAFFTLGARHIPAIESALIGALDAPLAPLWVWLAFGEVPGQSTLVGGAIVFAAVTAHIVVGAMRSGGKAVAAE